MIDSLQNTTNVTIVDPLPYFFPEGDYSILSLDSDHIPRVGAHLLKPLLELIFNLYQPQQGASDNP